MIAILLPGLHGSDELFDTLIEQLSGCCTCRAIDYQKDRLLSYDELAELVITHLPENEDFIIIAESFGGPIAYLIAKNAPQNLKFVVYAASFIDNPNKLLLKFRFLLPFLFKLSARLPDKILNMALLGGMGSQAHVHKLKALLLGFPVALFRYRLNALSRLSMPMDKTDVKAIYIRPRSDYLVTDSGYLSVAKRHKTVHRIETDGTHFLFQSNPLACAKIIKAELAKLKTG